MGILHNYESLLTSLPEVERPRYILKFKEKIKWLLIVLIIYYLLNEAPLVGLNPKAVDYFESVRAVIASKFGSIMTLGIGPIVSASIILQILVGGKLIDLDLSNPRDRALFQGAQKLLAVLFTIFEASVMVLMGALPAINNDPYYQLLVIAQLTLGGLLVIYLDEVVSKWAIGSGIGLFIAAGVCSQIVIGSLNPLPAIKGEVRPAGRIPAFIYTIMNGSPDWGLLVPILGTIIVFLAVVYSQSMRVEIPLTYGRFRGARGRYPIKFIYASNIPVIFASIFLANFQLWARLMDKFGRPLLGTFVENRPVGGLAYYLQIPRPIYSPDFNPVATIIYAFVLIILSMLFSKFWVDTTGMDAKTVAQQLQRGGMTIPGFRGDIRIIERVLLKYIPAITLLGGAAVGMLAAFGDLTGALGGGTGVLLTVGIVYNLYEQIAKEQLMELHPTVRKLFGEVI